MPKNNNMKDLQNSAKDKIKEASRYLKQKTDIEKAKRLLDEAKSAIETVIDDKNKNDPYDKKGFGISYRLLAEIHLELSRAHDQPNLQKVYLDQALLAANQADRSYPNDKFINLQIAEIYDQYAKYFSKENDFLSAVKYNQLALSKYTEHRASDPKYNERYAHYHRHLGYQKFTLAESQNKYSDQKKYFQESVYHYLESIQTGISNNSIDNNIVGEYFLLSKRYQASLAGRGEFQGAIEVCKKAYEIAHQFSDNQACADFCGHLGRLYLSNSDINASFDSEKGKNFDQAAAWLRQGMHHEMALHKIGSEEHKYLHNRHALEKLYRAMASWKLNHDNPDGAIEWATIAEDLAKKNIEPRKQAYGNVIMAASFWKKTDYQAAFTRYDQAITQLSQYFKDKTEKNLIDLFSSDEKQVYLKIKSGELELNQNTIKSVSDFHRAIDQYLKEENRLSMAN